MIVQKHCVCLICKMYLADFYTSALPRLKNELSSIKQSFRSVGVQITIYYNKIISKFKF